MESRFTFKDFVFVVLILTVIGAVVWMSWQYSYNEGRVTDLKKEVVRLEDSQNQQLQVLTDIRNVLRSGVKVNGAAGGGEAAETQGASTEGVGGAEGNGRIRRTNPDGSIYVYYPDVPPSAGRDPRQYADYAMGDWLVQNLDTEPKVLTPYVVKDYTGEMAQVPVLEGLVGINCETFQVEPVLAESYWMSGDGLKIRFTLRSNACFSDGSPVTADDVLFSYNTLMDTSVDSASVRAYFDNVDSCKKVDNRTVEFTMKKPYFLSLSSVGGLLQIIPEHVYKYKTGDEYNRRGDLLVGTGPYKVERWDRGQQIVMTRNEHYYGPRATFDRLIFKFISNEQAAFQAFEDGQIDRYEPTGDQYEKFNADPEFKEKFKAYKYLRVNSGYGFIGWNLKRPMFKDKETRRALTMLLDRNAMIDTLYKKMGGPEAGPFNPLSPQHDPSIQPLPYDPEGAKQLLAQAGWKPGPDGVLTRDGVKFSFALSFGAGSPMIDRAANYLKNQYASAGIHVELTPWEFSVLNQKLDERDFDGVFMAWMRGSTPEDDPYQTFDSASIANKGSNFISWDNKESDRLMEEARTTMDEKKRNELWHQWEKLMVDEQPYTFIMARYDRTFINGRFKNTEPYKLDVIPYDWYVPTALQKYH